MMCKDCRQQARTPAIAKCHAVTLLIAAMLVATPIVRAGTVKVWPQAVVVDDAVRLSQIAEITGFSRAEEQTLVNLVVVRSPDPGSATTLDMQAIRQALANSGVNMARLTLRGAVHCSLNRPGVIEQEDGDQTPAGRESRRRKAGARGSRRHTAGGNRSSMPVSADGRNPALQRHPLEGEHKSSPRTLRQAVIDHFNVGMQRFGGEADVLFVLANEQVLDLQGEVYSFVVRKRRGEDLGRIDVEVAVMQDGREVQRVPVRVDVRLVREVFVARGPVNRGVNIRESDIRRTRMYFSQTRHLGLTDPSDIIGQRSTRFIKAGSVIEKSDLEEMPLVLRGQPVTIESIVGGIKVVTAGKATENGNKGDVITVSDLNKKRVEYDAIVVGVGVVRVGGPPPASATPSP